MFLDQVGIQLTRQRLLQPLLTAQTGAGIAQRLGQRFPRLDMLRIVLKGFARFLHRQFGGLQRFVDRAGALQQFVLRQQRFGPSRKPLCRVPLR